MKEAVMGWYVKEVGDRECFLILAGKPFARHPFGRPRRWEDNIKLGLSEVGYVRGLRNWYSIVVSGNLYY
jgi:hypothetical protein